MSRLTRSVEQSGGCKDFASKVLACWLPVSAFASLGFEHCIASMFFVPLGIHHGAEITWGKFFYHNLLPVPPFCPPVSTACIRV